MIKCKHTYQNLCAKAVLSGKFIVSNACVRTV